MNLYSWSSDLLKDHFPGKIIVSAKDVESAREAVRLHFMIEFRHKRYNSQEDRQIDIDRMERDIAPEPNLHIRRVVFLHG